MPVLTPQLPQKLTEVAGDERTTKAISWIAQRWQLKSFQDFVSKGAKIDEAFSQSQVAALSQTIGEVLAGRLHPNFVVKTLQERLNIPQERARDIAHDVSREIFSRARQELMEYYRITPQQKVAHPQSAELRRTDAEERRQEEAVKPSMPQAADLRRPDADLRGQETPNQNKFGTGQAGDGGQETEREQTPTPPEDRGKPFDDIDGEQSRTTQGKPSLAEQVEEIADLRGLNADLRRNDDEAKRASQTPESPVPPPQPAQETTPQPMPEPPADENENQSPDDTEGKHFEPGPEQVIDLR